MPRIDIEFKTADGVVLRGWFYRPEAQVPVTPDGADEVSLPCIVMVHGFTAIKEMALDAFAERFVAELPVTCLVYDNRGLGASDTAAWQPRCEILPAQQITDLQDAITYAQSRPEVDAARIAIWGNSYSGGHVLRVGATDHRVRVVLSQVPLVDGWTNYHRLFRTDFMTGMNTAYEEDRLARAAGRAPVMVPVVDADPMKPCVLPTADSRAFLASWADKGWRNEVTLRSVEAVKAYNAASDIHRISPRPLLMTVGDNDVVVLTELCLEAYARAREPKELHLLPGGHFDVLRQPLFERNVAKQVDFLRRYLV